MSKMKDKIMENYHLTPLAAFAIFILALIAIVRLF